MTEFLFSDQSKWLWVAAMALAMFFPVRKLIWVMTVRRAIRKGGGENVDEAEQARLMRRASFTSALLSFVFSLYYVSHFFKS